MTLIVREMFHSERSEEALHSVIKLRFGGTPRPKLGSLRRAQYHKSSSAQLCERYEFVKTPLCDLLAAYLKGCWRYH